MSYMKLAKISIQQLLNNFAETALENHLPSDKAYNPESGDVLIYEHPIVGVSSALDGLYETYKEPRIIGANYLKPTEWLDGAKSVISIFNPFTQQIKDSNRGGGYPSDAWMHGRIEGQAYVVAAAQNLVENLKSKGYKAIVPVADKRFHVYTEPKIYSNWSERHGAYASGLGTFSRNRAVITEKGTAGRFCSVITDMTLDPDNRPYKGIYDYCIMCGACQKACPVKAINEHGKAHEPCKRFLSEVLAEHAPWYGCGKCQCGMPCESSIPLEYNNKLSVF